MEDAQGMHIFAHFLIIHLLLDFVCVLHHHSLQLCANTALLELYSLRWLWRSAWAGLLHGWSHGWRGSEGREAGWWALTTIRAIWWEVTIKHKQGDVEHMVYSASNVSNYKCTYVVTFCTNPFTLYFLKAAFNQLTLSTRWKHRVRFLHRCTLSLKLGGKQFDERLNFKANIGEM